MVSGNRRWALWISAAALLGCGPPFAMADDLGEGGSGGGGDAGGGGAAGPPTTHSVTVVGSDGAAVAGAQLVLGDAAGAVAGVQAADAKGAAVVEVPAGGSVAAFWSEGAHRFIAAVYEPPAGSTLRLEPMAAPPPESNPSLGAPTTFAIGFTDVLPAGPEDYAIGSTCDESSGSLVGAIEVTNAQCKGAPSIDALLLFWDGSQSARYWGAVLGMAPSPGSKVHANLQQISADFAEVKQEIERLPADSDVNSRVLVSKGTAVVMNPLTLAWQEETTSGRRSRVPVVPGGVLETLDRVTLRDTSETARLERWWRATGQLPERSLFDAGAEPRLSGLTIDASAVAQPELGWSASEGTPADCAAAWWRWGHEGGYVQFSAVLPAHRTSVRLAEIPEELAAYRPVADTHAKENAAVYRSPETPGFAACVDGKVRLRDPAASPGEHFVSWVERESP